MPTKILNSYKPYVSCGTSANKGNPDKAGVSRAGGAAKIRSKTFPGVAKAMALQWGNLEGGVDLAVLADNIFDIVSPHVHMKKIEQTLDKRSRPL